MLFEHIEKLVQYGIDTGLTPECERIYTRNLLLELFHEDTWEDVDVSRQELELESILKELLDEAVERGIIEDSIVYKHRQGICFETQHYPDAINHENFPSPIVKKGEEYRTRTVYKFV